MNPTVIGERTQFNPTEAMDVSQQGSWIVLSPEQKRLVAEKAATIDFASMPAAQVTQLGFEAEQELHRTLDGFLSRLDRESASQVFALFDRLQKGVEDAKLPNVLKRIKTGARIGVLTKLAILFRRETRENALKKANEEVRQLVSGRTKTLQQQMNQLERELGSAMNQLIEELKQLDELKHAYGDEFRQFAVEAAIAQCLLEEARKLVREMEMSVQPEDVVMAAEIQGMKAKLQLLESRALALEGTYTRLPSDALVIQQLEQAGVSTLQETATTASSRFASIKMTLLALHGAFAVSGVQQLAARQAKLDQQLADVRGQLMRQVVGKAATAAGDNRLAQANQIEQLIREAGELRDIVAEGRRINDEKFNQAREKFAAARQELASLAKK